MDGTGTTAENDRLNKLKENLENEESESESAKDAAPINENLFLDENLGDLDGELDDSDDED